MKKFMMVVLAFVAVLSAKPAVAQTIVNQTRRVDVFATSRDAIFDEDQVIQQDSESTRAAGTFDETVEVTASTITGDTNAFASQTSEINTATLEVRAEGNAISRVIEDGDARTDSESFLRVRFDLANPGKVTFSELVLEVSQPTVAGDPRIEERASEARAFVRIFDQDTGVRVFNRIVRLNDDGDYDFVYEQVVVDLPAGRYRMIARAIASGDNDNNTVQGEPHGSRSDFSIEATISEN